VAGGQSEPVSVFRVYHLSCWVLCDAEVLAMALWEEVDGRTWIERAGPRRPVTDADARPRRRRRARRIRQAVPRPVAPGRLSAVTPVGTTE
jgi:hypothetical protein